MQKITTCRWCSKETESPLQRFTYLDLNEQYYTQGRADRGDLFTFIESSSCRCYLSKEIYQDNKSIFDTLPEILVININPLVGENIPASKIIPKITLETKGKKI